MIDDTIKEEHPSFGVIRITRSSGHMALFDSAFHHSHTVSLEVLHASRRRNLARDWISPEAPIVRIAMSEAQFARAICSAGMGEGVPCTIERLHNQGMPKCPDDETRKRFKLDLTTDITDIRDNVNDIVEQIRAISDQKGTVKAEDKRKLTNLAERLRREVLSNLPFLEQSYGERLDTLTQEAKTIVENHVITLCATKGIPLTDMPTLELGETKQITEG